MHKFEYRIALARKAKDGPGEPYDQNAFNEYLHWFLANSRVQILPDAYEEEILEEPLQYEDVAAHMHNRRTRRGYDTSHGQLLSFAVSKELANTTAG